MMSSEKSERVRRIVNDRRSDWKAWKSIHTWVYVILGTVSAGISAFVASITKAGATTKPEVIGNHVWLWALASAIITFLITALGAQAQAKAFEVGARMLEAGLAQYDTDPDFGDLELGRVLADAIQALNKAS